ncbi:MAG: hypothetical protein ABI461_05520 [Polyangiaceae bacterium]
MTTHVKWTRGGEATILRVAGESISLSSTTSAPPGARIDGTLDIREGAPLRVKVQGSKKQPDGAFVIEGRCIDMSRELRVELEAASAKSPEK